MTWLDAPPAPESSLLEALQRDLSEHPEVEEAWLVRTHVVPEGTTGFDQTVIALAFREVEEPGTNEVAELVAALHRCDAVNALDVGAWILLNENLRPRVREHGRLIYSAADTTGGN